MEASISNLVKALSVSRWKTRPRCGPRTRIATSVGTTRPATVGPASGLASDMIMERSAPLQCQPPIPQEFDIDEPSDGLYAKICNQIISFASQLQQTIENYNLLLSLVSSVTYKWGVDRSGASQQNLGVMVSILQQCQEMILSSVSGRLSPCPRLLPWMIIWWGVEEVERERESGAEAEDVQIMETKSAPCTTN
jgi:hypothetical protein